MSRLVLILGMIGAIALSIKPALADFIDTTGYEYSVYETALGRAFSYPELKPHMRVYLRKSDRERKLDAWIACAMLKDISVKEYMQKRAAINSSLYGKSTMFSDSMFYDYAVLATAVDIICTEHRAIFWDFVEGR